jgi:hypothetical protein
MRKIMQVESGGDARARTGRYKGLFQLSDQEFRNHGGSGSISDPEQNTMAAANKIAKEKVQFEQKEGRPATLQDIYMIHQQGPAGYSAHLANPGAPAWTNVRKYYPSDKVAKEAIWGNMTPAMKAKYGNVESVSSADFTGDWSHRIEGQTIGPAGAAERARKRREGIPEDAGQPTGVSQSDKDKLAKMMEIPQFQDPGFRVPSLTPNIRVANPEE